MVKRVWFAVGHSTMGLLFCSKAFASRNCLSLCNPTIHRAVRGTIRCAERSCSIALLSEISGLSWSVKSCLRCSSIGQSRSTCLALSLPVLQSQVSFSIPCTFALFKNIFSPFRPVRNWISAELSALLRFLCRRRIFLSGGSQIYPTPKPSIQSLCQLHKLNLKCLFWIKLMSL